MSAQFRPRVGTVTAVSSDSCTVLVNNGEVFAYLNDQTRAAVVVGGVVTLLPVGDTYEVISTRSGTAHGGGVTLGTELLPNADFEYGPGGVWGGPSAWTIEWDYSTGEPVPFAWDTNPADAVSGSGSVLVTIAAGTWTHQMNAVPENPVAVDVGKTYQASTWLRASINTAGLAMTLRTYTADTAANCWQFGAGVATTDHVTVTNPGAAYQLVSGTFVVPTGHHFARVALRTTAPTGAALTASWDKASLRQRITS